MRQLDLLSPAGLSLTPGPLDQPRLWIQRLTIWSDCQGVIFDEELVPGLNIVWSPDPDDRGRDKSGSDETGPGHGAGKTLFCRLIRYCLGEPRFAAAELQGRIAHAFSEGRVGAEVVIDGRVWGVVRSLSSLPWDVVRENTTVDAMRRENPPPTGMAPLTNALTEQLITPSVARLVGNEEDAWLTGLAWLTRDQECRLGKVTDWRAAASASGSPARELSAKRTVRVMRVLLGAMTPAEHELEAEIDALKTQRTTAERALERATWELERACTRTAKLAGMAPSDLPPLEMQVAAIRTTAATNLRMVTRLAEDETESDALEAARDRARNESQRLDLSRRDEQTRIGVAKTSANLLEEMMPGLSAEVRDAERPTCPICEVPIDRALAEGCKLSHKLDDLAEVRERRDRARQNLTKHLEEQADAERALAACTKELAAARKREDAAQKALDAARQRERERTDAWYLARRVRDDLHQLEELLADHQHAEATLRSTKAALKDRRGDEKRARRQHSPVVGRLAVVFDALVRQLLGPKARGRLALEDKGLELNVEYGGERSTPAINLTKIVAFDIACMCRSVEGAVHLPAFLIHDSPREADLGLSIYHRLFRAARDLEEVGPQPLFQYIVTTTTRPPDELAIKPWLRFTIHGSPALQRLLQRDL